MILLALAACAAPKSEPLRTPEGAVLDADPPLAYPPGALSVQQLGRDNADLLVQRSMNVFRRFAPDKTADMVRFYTEALALRSLAPIQLTRTQQMILVGVGSGQIKLSAGQQGDRRYDLAGGVRGGTGIRYLRLRYPDQAAVARRFTESGWPAPDFRDRGPHRTAIVSDPAGLAIELVIDPRASDHGADGLGVGIGVSNIAASEAFYRDFVGLRPVAPIQDAALGIAVRPLVHGETAVLLHQVAPGGGADTGSSGLQYVVSDAALVAARASHRGVTVETPLNRLSGFDLVTVWLNDPDGVTNYFAQVGPRH
ncbi:hypothetical protein GCM10011411_04120 [Aurantiacibacter arachoides]|nr:hypothetical protein GCM10011411_04120 [Aurantiacibacter arachoides]